MAGDGRAVLRVSAEAAAYVREVAQGWGCSISEAADRLLRTARGRRAALAAYAAKGGGKRAKTLGVRRRTA